VRIFLKEMHSNNAFQSVLFALWNQLLQNELREFSYMAEMAYLGTSIEPSMCCLNISIGGYNDSLEKYVQELFEKIGLFSNVEKEKFLI
jgi:secreted Zn-dependent insulinase-like peptidase